MLSNLELFEKNVGMLQFVTLETDLALKVLFMIMRLLSTCTVLCYCLWKKLLLLACFIVIKYEV